MGGKPCQTLEAARGLWPRILVALGVPKEALNGRNGPCIFCGGKDRARFTDYKGDGYYFCNQCFKGNGINFLMAVRGWDFRTAASEVDGVIGKLSQHPRPAVKREPDWRAQYCRVGWLWRKTRPASDVEPVRIYLKRRGLRALDSPYLRGMRNCIHPSGKVLSAMICGVVSWEWGLMNLHYTYLTDDGEKSCVDPVKCMLPGAKFPKGGAIPFAEPVDGLLGVAEGVETALSAARLHGVPVWAATNANALRSIIVPDGVKKVFVFGDNDANNVGQHAAYALAARLVKEGLAVDVHIPEMVGDWNDVLVARIGGARPEVAGAHGAA